MDGQFRPAADRVWRHVAAPRLEVEEGRGQTVLKVPPRTWHQGSDEEGVALQRDYPRVQLAKEVRPGDFEDALWTAYMNCINALKVPQSSSVSDHGTSYFVSAPSWEAFQSQVSIDYCLCLGYGILAAKLG